MTRAGIEPATFRFVAQNLNLCAIAVNMWYLAEFFLELEIFQIEIVEKF